MVRAAVAVEPAVLEATQTRIMEAQEVLGQHLRLPDHPLHALAAVEEGAGARLAILRERRALEAGAPEATALLPLEQAQPTLVAGVVVVATQATLVVQQAVLEL